MKESRKRAAWFLALLAMIGIVVYLFEEEHHLEKCVSWGFENDQFAATNLCAQSVYVQFQKAGDPEIGAKIPPGKSFFTGVTPRELEMIGRPCYDYWMFAACPEGYVSSQPFWPENCKAIIASGYDCVRKWRVLIKPRSFVNF